MPKSILVLGTTNSKKREELADLLEMSQLQIKTLADFANLPDVIEDGRTYLENAAKKAVTLARALGHWVLGEDSGLVVDALGGAPGIFSARYAGEGHDDERNNDKLLAELAQVPQAQRTAHYVCAAVLADPSGALRASAEGSCDGLIASCRRGSNGFGYDPLFLIPERGRTFGELPPEFKRTCSHRTAAIRLLRPQLLELLDGGEWAVSSKQ